MRDNLYGFKPVDLGLVDLSPKEMMFWLYCPIKMADRFKVVIPSNLRQFEDIVNAVYRDVASMRWLDSYVYITAKTLWVTHENPGNRRGWHSDGFMTDDLNYIWSDSRGTLFWEPDEATTFIQDHTKSLDEMEAKAERGPFKTYPDKHLLRLDQGVIHRVADFESPGMRTFVKISVSRHQYRLAGNSINHGLAPDWAYVERAAERNTPEVTAP
ncbi:MULTISPECIES: hypothetical protein [Mesorhizobium]|uniref:hypothetical protein n=1 Tax=Mesorhizobium TaxID=68287 RepID=UPI0007A94AEB|nr:MULTISPECIES: hypothetical protein [Mesorhizobium]AMX93764.1 hypothetical protein A4R28_11935 [Mesorhizobium ciceri]MDF3208467.1 hypothetical protein [Mesorhizobium sp. LMG15046]MDF3228962.1 hypothetical protein [Mesorhizobium sp. DSM 30133]RUU22083.1 hypothetical protein EOC84_02945 [Mesorhizobium sp. Primo-B]RUU38007.1 hypothetical protein EOC83_17270 [Mesorhizobium sp. Primo-A]